MINAIRIGVLIFIIGLSVYTIWFIIRPLVPQPLGIILGIIVGLLIVFSIREIARVSRE